MSTTPWKVIASTGPYARGTHPDRVLETVVRGRGEDEVRDSELLEIPEALELVRVDHGDDQRVELHMPVNRVIEDYVVEDRKGRGGS